jgi:hypothetical protein
MNAHQLNQIKVIDLVDSQIKKNDLKISTVSPVRDFYQDKRLCLTSVHLPRKDFLSEVTDKVIKPLKNISPEHFYYDKNLLHITIKNIRVINDPPNFNENDKETAGKVFAKIIPIHQNFFIYYYRLLLFPLNLALIGTTDSELDLIINDLDSELNKNGVPDDKIYINNKYFFSNITLARFNKPPTEEFKQEVQKLSSTIDLKPYLVDSVTLATASAVFLNRQIIGTWNLN